MDETKAPEEGSMANNPEKPALNVYCLLPAHFWSSRGSCGRGGWRQVAVATFPYSPQNWTQAVPISSGFPVPFLPTPSRGRIALALRETARNGNFKDR
jgi:hypothetical protein